MDFAIIGLPYDKTQTLRTGAAKAPALIRKTFPMLETYIYGVDLADKAFIKDLGDTKADLDGMEAAIADKLASAKKAFPIFLGGDHSVTIAAASALKPEKVVIFDAHADCEEGERHDGIVRRLTEKFGKENIYMVGVRVASKKEDDFIKKNKIKIIEDFRELAKIKGKIYVSVDFDVLDPSVIASVGNPEPMGHSFAELSDALNILAPRMIGLDFTEFTPMAETDEMGIHALMAGKMVYGAMAGIVRARK